MGKSNKRKTAKTPKKSNKRGPGRPYTPPRKTCVDCNQQYTYGDCKYCKKTNKLSIVNDEPYEEMKLETKIDNAGAIFIGENSPEVFGDYCAGPNHVLPTSGSAKYASPLGVYDFLKRTSLMKISSSHSRELSSTASLLADCEGLTAHSQSAKLRK